MKNKLVSIALSLLIAFGLWMYVITEVSPNSEQPYLDIPVKMEGETLLRERNLIITDISSTNVDLTLSGNRTDLNELNSSNITLKADMTKIYDPGVHKIGYDIILPGHVASNAFTRVSQYPDFITVTVERLIRNKEIPVNIVYQGKAAEGYVVVAPNRRGLPSFGQEWLDQISGDYSGQNIRDYLAAIDDVAREPWSDEERLGAVGASYGGYSVYYLAGHHEGRFKALISHCGIFNFESMYGHTEELWFVNNDYGGSYWDKNNRTAQRSYANSPHKAVAKWDTPILIITGEQDFRIPFTQSLEAFTAAKLQGVPARLVAFENEAHQVFQPQNSLVWNREFFGWLNKYLK